MTRRSNRIAFIVCAGLSGAVLTASSATAQQPHRYRRPPAAAATAAEQPAATLPPGVTERAAESAQVSVASQYALPANAAERAAVSNRLSQGDCVQPSFVMSMSRMLDGRPLERPKPLIILKGDRDVNFGKLRAVLSSNGFAEVSSDVDSGELLVSRPDADNKGGRDDLLFWADGQAGDASRIRLYLQYGRFEPFFGSTAPQRVETPTDEVQKRIGAVRQAIVNLATGAT